MVTVVSYYDYLELYHSITQRCITPVTVPGASKSLRFGKLQYFPCFVFDLELWT